VKGTGTVSKRGESYIARLIIGHKDGKPVFRTSTRRTKSEASKELNLWLKSRPASVEAERCTFREVADAWLNHPKNSNDSTRETRMYALNHAVRYIGSMAVGRIDRSHISKVLSSMKSQGVGFATQLATYRTMKTLFNDLVEDDVLLKSPIGKRQLPVRAAHETKVAASPLTEEQVQLLLTGAKDMKKYYALYLIASRLGLREGELLALHCDDVNLTCVHPYLDVRRHLVKSGGSYIIAPLTKSGFSRHVLVPKTFVPYLAEAVLTRKGIGLLFPAPEGGIYNPKNFVNRNWHKLLEAVGLPKMRFHMLRHTATTHALERGEPPQVICQRLGWKSTRMLNETYGHLTDRLSVGSVDAMDQVVGLAP
jgi:integrase